VDFLTWLIPARGVFFENAGWKDQVSPEISRVEGSAGWKDQPGGRISRVEGLAGWKDRPGGRIGRVEGSAGWKDRPGASDSNGGYISIRKKAFVRREAKTGYNRVLNTTEWFCPSRHWQRLLVRVFSRDRHSGFSHLAHSGAWGFFRERRLAGSGVSRDQPGGRISRVEGLAGWKDRPGGRIGRVPPIPMEDILVSAKRLSSDAKQKRAITGF
jgi:hypothetical protein